MTLADSLSDLQAEYELRRWPFGRWPKWDPGQSIGKSVQEPLRSPAPRTQVGSESLSEEDRVWLAERLVEYRDLLEFLHAN